MIIQMKDRIKRYAPFPPDRILFLINICRPGDPNPFLLCLALQLLPFGLGLVPMYHHCVIGYGPFVQDSNPLRGETD